MANTSICIVYIELYDINDILSVHDSDDLDC
jgi:hypothetical protein